MSEENGDESMEEQRALAVRAEDIIDQTLPENKRLAIQMIILGVKPGEIIKELGVDPHTYYRWKKDPHFVSALEHAKNEMCVQGETRLLGLIDKAIIAVEKNIDEGVDGKLAFELLKKIGVFQRTDGMIRRERVDAFLRSFMSALQEVVPDEDTRSEIVERMKHTWEGL